jgi:hypothetical protein
MGLLAAGCTAGSAQTANPTATAAVLGLVAAQAAPVAASPTPLPTPKDLSYEGLGTSGTWLDEEPLGVLSQVAAETADQTGGIGVAVIVPSLGVAYELNGDAQFKTESVVKVPIMLTLLDQAISDGRQLTDDERYELALMITESDNDAANWLYEDVGGGAGVTAFLESAGIDDAAIDPADWGDSALSPMDAATLMTELIGGTILDAPSRELAMDLLGSVDPLQAWGAVLLASGAGETGVKNGWYPEFDGWVLNSAGFVKDADGVPPYTIAVFSDGQPDFYAGIRTIEMIGRQVHQALVAQAGSGLAH